MKVSKLTYLKDNVRKLIGESVTYVDVLERIYNKTRGRHNTIALVTAAEQHKGVILCHDAKWAKELHERFDVDTMVYTDPKIFTFQGPIILDLPVLWEFVKAHARLEKSSTELLNFMDQKGVD